MRRLTYQNARGDTISFYLSPLLIESLEGIAEVEANIQGQKSPGQDGDIYLGSTLEPRYIDLEGSITKTGLTDIKKYRSKIIKVCNPNLGLGELTLELDGDIKKIYGILDGVPVFPEKGRSPFQNFLISWKCPNPFWQSTSPINTKLEDFVSNFRFPFSFPVRFATRGDNRVLINEGDANTPIKVTFRGSAINPVLKNETTGEYIKVNYTIPSGYELVICTAQGDKRVELIGEDGTKLNVFNYIDLGSSFFNLVVGENEISFTTEGGNPDVYVEYNNLFIGV